MKALCIRSCTVPGLGLVEKGQTVEIPEGAWEKHFDVQKAPKAPEAPKAPKAPEAPKAPKAPKAPEAPEAKVAKGKKEDDDFLK